MKLLDIKNFKNTTFENLKEANLGCKIELLTFKKDRKLTIIKTDENKFNVIEDGFKYKEFNDLDISKLEQILTDIRKIEFPRSNKFFLNIIKG